MGDEKNVYHEYFGIVVEETTYDEDSDEEWPLEELPGPADLEGSDKDSLEEFFDDYMSLCRSERVEVIELQPKPVKKVRFSCAEDYDVITKEIQLLRTDNEIDQVTPTICKKMGKHWIFNDAMELHDQFSPAIVAWNPYITERMFLCPFCPVESLIFEQQYDHHLIAEHGCFEKAKADIFPRLTFEEQFSEEWEISEDDEDDETANGEFNYKTSKVLVEAISCPWDSCNFRMTRVRDDKTPFNYKEFFGHSLLPHPKSPVDFFKMLDAEAKDGEDTETV